MDTELENKLAEDFPFMRITINPDEPKNRNRYVGYGCECGGGWYDLLYGMCGEITEAYKKHGQPVDIVVDQIKEKFGTLRFYYHHEGQEKGINAIDFLGASIRISSKDTELHRKISGIVDKWEKKSAEVCERCGKPGVLRKDLSWVLTLCDDCYSKK
ncbi:MAG: hypothetical protein NC203_02985 [Firmicutes bacterium]|nr:hypothetical protein [[Eubacterium] siraeum]MCM1487309.1 hypothetical protein [Bacillota bacterium]